MTSRLGCRRAAGAAPTRIATAPVGGPPCIARGSGNAATPAASPRQLQSGQAAPPTNAVGDRFACPWERQRRDSSGESTTASVGAGSPSHECGWRQVRAPVGAATPRHQRQVHDSFSRGRQPLPRMRLETDSRSRGSGNAATPAASQRQLQSGQEAPPTNAVGDRFALLWERQRRDSSGESTTASVGAGSPSHECGWRQVRVSVGAATPRHQRLVHDSLSRGRKLLPQIPFETDDRPCRSGACAAMRPGIFARIAADPGLTRMTKRGAQLLAKGVACGPGPFDAGPQPPVAAHA